MLAAAATFCSMAQGRSLNPKDKALWVIDGLVMDTLTVAHGEFVTDSIEPWLERYFPLIKMDDIKEVRLLRSGDVMPTTCYGTQGRFFCPKISFGYHLREPVNRTMCNECNAR